jgi:hypothetical protein
MNIHGILNIIIIIFFRILNTHLKNIIICVRNILGFLNLIICVINIIIVIIIQNIKRKNIIICEINITILILILLSAELIGLGLWVMCQGQILFGLALRSISLGSYFRTQGS